MPLSPNNIRAFRQNKNWTLQQLADACATSKSQIDKLEKGDRRLTVEWMVRLAKPLGCDPRDLLTAPLGGLATRDRVQNTKETTELLPVLGASIQGKNKTLTLTKTPIDHIQRPHALTHTQDAYAFYVTSESMHPMYRLRQMLFINPHKPPMPECGVVVIKTDGTALLGCYGGTKKNGIELREYGAKPRCYVVAFNDIEALHAVIGATEPQ